MEHGDDGRSRDDVMDGPALPPDEPGRILDPFRKAFAWARVRLNLSGEIFGTPQCPVARILAPVLTVLGASILVCDLCSRARGGRSWPSQLWRPPCFPWDTGRIRSTR